VLVVDDSALFREVIARGISTDPGIFVVATAGDPFEARDHILRHHPDVMICDVHMPKMNGIEFLRRLLPQYPLPVIVVSAVSSTVFDALNAGAIDFVRKPDSRLANIEKFLEELIEKIRIASRAKVVRPASVTDGRFAGRATGKADSRADGRPVERTGDRPGKKDPGDRMGKGPGGRMGRMGEPPEVRPGDLSAGGKAVRLIAIGASTGGTEAIYTLLRALPRDIPGIVIVQHISPGFSRIFAERLNMLLPFRVKEAESGDFTEAGTVLIAPGDRHMRVKRAGDRFRVECYAGEKVSGHCPSVDVLFESVAKEAGNRSVGILLTGMGYDGAKGLLAMRRKGARTIGQDEESSVVYGMPKVAFELGAVEKQSPLADIPRLLLRMLG